MGLGVERNSIVSLRADGVFHPCPRRPAGRPSGSSETWPFTVLATRALVTRFRVAMGYSLVVLNWGLRRRLGEKEPKTLALWIVVT